MGTRIARSAAVLAGASMTIIFSYVHLRAQEDWERYVSLTVQADTTDVYTRPWDGIGSAGGIASGWWFFMPNLSSPPDMAVCVVTQDRHECYDKEKDGKPISFCQDSYDCEWVIRVPDRGAFGLVVYDIDTLAYTMVNTTAHNLIDAGGLNDLVDVLLVANGSDEDLSGLEASVRRLTEEISNTKVGVDGHWTVPIAPGEDLRRERDLPVRPLDGCAAEACRLQQSTFLLRPAS